MSIDFDVINQANSQNSVLHQDLENGVKAALSENPAAPSHLALKAFAPQTKAPLPYIAYGVEYGVADRRNRFIQTFAAGNFGSDRVRFDLMRTIGSSIARDYSTRYLLKGGPPAPVVAAYGETARSLLLTNGFDMATKHLEAHPFDEPGQLVKATPYKLVIGSLFQSAYVVSYITHTDDSISIHVDDEHPLANTHDAASQTRLMKMWNTVVQTTATEEMRNWVATK